MEFALIAPLLLTLLFGIVDYGYMLVFRQAVSQAAAEAARSAAVLGATGPAATPQQLAAARAAVDDTLRTFDVTCSGTTLRRRGVVVGTCLTSVAPCANEPSRDCASVTLTYHYEDHPLIPSVPGLGVVLPEDLTYVSVVRAS